jgi:hypothetical protein
MKILQKNKIYEMKFDLTFSILKEYNNRKFHKIVSRNMGINTVFSSIRDSAFNKKMDNLLW